MAGKSGRNIESVPKDVLKKRLLSWEGVLFLLFIGVNIFCRIISPNYNFNNVLREMPKYLCEIFLLLPMAYILILGDIDISVGSTVCLCATAACMFYNSGLPFALVFVVSLLVGLLCGIINGLLVTRFTELPAMIITLATQIVFRGISEILLGSGGSLSLTNHAGFKALAGKVGPFRYVFFVVVILSVVFTIISFRTNFGRWLFAIGSNSKTSYYSGIKVQQVRLFVFALTGLMAGIAAMFLTSTSYAVNTMTGKGFEMDAIAMAVFGGISSTGGKGKLVGGIISAFTIVCLRIGLGQRNMNPQLILLILGILLITAVMIPNLVGDFKARKAMKK